MYTYIYTYMYTFKDSPTGYGCMMYKYADAPTFTHSCTYTRVCTCIYTNKCKSTWYTNTNNHPNLPPSPIQKIKLPPPFKIIVTRSQPSRCISRKLVHTVINVCWVHRQPPRKTQQPHDMVTPWLPAQVPDTKLTCASSTKWLDIPVDPLPASGK